jgi:hypothetical protein
MIVGLLSALPIVYVLNFLLYAHAVLASSDELAFRIRDRIMLDFAGWSSPARLFEQQCGRLLHAGS